MIKTEVDASRTIYKKVWWQDATLFVYFHIYNIHTFNQSQYIHPSPFAEASLHFFIACMLSGAEPRIELGPALQQADALPYKIHSTAKSRVLPVSFTAESHGLMTPNVPIVNYFFTTTRLFFSSI
jgi:hypothetical protein